MCALLGIGAPVLNSCGLIAESESKSTLKPGDSVIVIGAGAAGLSAAYLLQQQGIHVQILEASHTYGGRMKRTTDFTDFPIPTGAEWLHNKRNTLDKIVNDPSVKITTVTKEYNYKVDQALVDGKEENLKSLGFTIEQKFINATWFDFFEAYIVPSIKSKIRYNEVVRSIDYGTDQVVVETATETYKAAKVIVTVPVKMLQLNTITFKPPLPEKKTEAISNVKVWGGCKAFIAFSEKFYPTAVGFGAIPEDQGHKMFYDAAYGQATEQPILGIFAVGPAAQPYLTRNDYVLIRYLLAELDEMFDGKASPAYQKHIFQNWSKEPFAQGAYVHYFEDWKNIRTLGKPVADKVYFAGDAYTDGSGWSSVDAAAEAARRAVAEMV